MKITLNVTFVQCLYFQGLPGLEGPQGPPGKEGQRVSKLGEQLAGVRTDLDM